MGRMMLWAASTGKLLRPRRLEVARPRREGGKAAEESAHMQRKDPLFGDIEAGAVEVLADREVGDRTMQHPADLMQQRGILRQVDLHRVGGFAHDGLEQFK